MTIKYGAGKKYGNTWVYGQSSDNVVVSGTINATSSTSGNVVLWQMPKAGGKLNSDVLTTLTESIGSLNTLNPTTLDEDR